MSGNLKIGDRVKLASLGPYCHSESQGLVIGNTATVTYVEKGGNIGIVTDNADSNHNGEHLTNADRPAGWPLKAECLHLVKAIQSPVKPINYQRLALSMSKAKTIKQAREIYTKGIKVPAKKGK